MSNPLQGRGEEAKRLRQQVGQRLKEMRLLVSKTQRDVAQDVGFEYYTMISQIEGGKARLPPEQIEAYAKSLDQPLQPFAKMLLQYYDPVTYRLIFLDKVSV